MAVLLSDARHGDRFRYGRCLAFMQDFDGKRDFILTRRAFQNVVSVACRCQGQQLTLIFQLCVRNVQKAEKDDFAHVLRQFLYPCDRLFRGKLLPLQAERPTTQQ